jgi:hypothetical protein
VAHPGKVRWATVEIFQPATLLAVLFRRDDDYVACRVHAMAILASRHKVRMHFLHPAPPGPKEHDESTD